MSLASSLHLYLNGKITGISGSLFRSITLTDFSYNFSFITGMLFLSSFIKIAFDPMSPPETVDSPVFLSAPPLWGLAKRQRDAARTDELHFIVPGIALVHLPKSIDCVRQFMCRLYQNEGCHNKENAGYCHKPQKYCRCHYVHVPFLSVASSQPIIRLSDWRFPQVCRGRDL